MRDGLLLHAVSSGIAGFVATSTFLLRLCIRADTESFYAAICSPADVIKSRIMARKVYAAVKLSKNDEFLITPIRLVRLQK